MSKIIFLPHTLPVNVLANYIIELPESKPIGWKWNSTTKKNKLEILMIFCFYTGLMAVKEVNISYEVLRINIAFIKIWFILNIFIRCVMQTISTKIWQYPEIKIGGFSFNSSEVTLVIIYWHSCGMARWLRPSFSVTICEDRKLWTHIMIDRNDRFLHRIKLIIIIDPGMWPFQI